ncbi:hypothetical protein G6F58_013000 [Rhizopus delemar]|nr:hypothetical protein G6F58_013000 [Rhizopus delemar]
MVEAFAHVADARDAGQPHPHAHITLAHPQRRLAQRVQVAPDGQGPPQQQDHGQHQAPRRPGGPGDPPLHRGFQRQTYIQPLHGVTGQAGQVGVVVVPHDETGTVQLLLLIRREGDAAVGQQRQGQPIVRQQLVQDIGRAGFRGDRVQLLVQRVDLAAHGTVGQIGAD